jgi:hypothetical protein
MAFSYPTGSGNNYDDDYEDDEDVGDRDVIPSRPDDDVVKKPGPEDLEDTVVRGMLARGRPRTRNNYLTRKFVTGYPREWSAELEARMPPMFRDPSYLAD